MTSLSRNVTLNPGHESWCVSIKINYHRRVVKKREAIPAWKLRDISKHASYHHTMSEEKAEEKLVEQNKTCYLTRYCATSKEFLLSVYKKGEEHLFANFEINIEKSDGRTTYEIFGAEEKFNSIAEMLNRYKKDIIDPEIGTIGDEIENEKAATHEDGE